MATSTPIAVLDRMQNVKQRFSSADNGVSYSLLPGHQYEVNVTTTGSAGSASGTTSIANVYGTLAELVVTYHASAPGTTVITISETIDGEDLTIVTLAAGNSTRKVVPLVQARDSADSAISGGYVYHVFQGSSLKVAVTLSDALTDAVTVFAKTM